MSQPVTLTTERLVLRPVGPEHGADYAAFAGVSEVANMTGTIKIGFDETAAKVRLERLHDCEALPFQLGMFCKLRDELIGAVSLTDGSEPYIGYMLAPEKWGQGYASEAVQAFLAYVMPRFGFKAIRACHFEDNQASGAVLSKLGFVQTHSEQQTSVNRLEPATCYHYRVTANTFGIRL